MTVCDPYSHAGDEPQRDIVVDWAGDNDPQKPTNWPSAKKWRIVFFVSLLTFISPFGSSMLAPSMEVVMSEFRSSNADLQSFTVSIYVLGYAFGPLIHAPVSELYGRQIPFLVNSALFILANVACALSTNLPMLIVFRFIVGVVGSCPLALGPASIADMFKQQHRGTAMAIWNLPVLFAPAIGPLVGAYLTIAGGWRWNCWFLAIGMGVLLIAMCTLFSETHAPTVLERKACALRRQYRNPSFVSALRPKTTRRATITGAATRPLKLLLLSPIVTTLSLCSAVSYGFIYLLFTSMTQAFTKRYGIQEPEVGLTYLGFGIGNIVANISLGLTADRLMKRLARGGEMKPEYRLPPLIPGSLLMPTGLLIYGWTLQYNVHWMVPEFGLFVFGLGTIYISMPVNTYLVDAFTGHAASATAANTVLRSLGGSLLPLCGDRMYAATGDGWGNSILAFVGVAFIPAVWFIYKNGERLRKQGSPL
ncbi:MFS dha1 multidrug resistance protein [Pleurostoma richardsiae]|uniref:MFS dha1 multidrug resistance protein n=1 Tax=Pleurostoma richardsiae TaxID=41990 RepID=A0AA38S6V6_9PEZI|nr:MFS dha1 multidrug resistance protein [Pleurostoma richardsiae]